ncbi:restriction endonuclease subunit S [Lactiplantibacillus argentoratensis]|uniref:restriction endonuclease subunit S n=1 Tax=Lactiplantibacillus argentoratensis TaxID=271881 RepID=UPI001CE04A2E|nr:restriction endonuclease subunit S [Lactiplantibacillus argentoratensis]MCA5598091.1 restriction endonuclease subunit S [Lactiplantibacillus argentoratensis]
MKNENLVPKVRFKGFSDPWEQRKLSSVVTLVKSYSITRDNERKSTNTEYIHYGDIHKFTNTIIDDHVTLPNIADGDYIPLNEGDLVLADASEDYVEIAKPLVLFKTDGRNIVSGLHTIALHPHDVESLFLYNVFNSQNFRRYGYKVGTGLKVFGVSSKNILKYSFNSPSMYEQKKIDSILLKLTDLIAANEDKLEQLKTLKKLMMQKIFSQEWRFKGFTDPWEQRQLSELAKYRRGSFPQPYGDKKWYGGESSMPFVQVVDIADNLKLFSATKQRISKLGQPKSVFVPKGHVIIALQGSIERSIGRTAITQYDTYIDRTLLVFEKFTKKVNVKFWAYIVKRKFDIEKLGAPGSTISTITKKELSNFEICLPKYDEQVNIGCLLGLIDNLIAANEDKLNQLKKLKKYLMQNMFV